MNITEKKLFSFIDENISLHDPSYIFCQSLKKCFKLLIDAYAEDEDEDEEESETEEEEELAKYPRVGEVWNDPDGDTHLIVEPHKAFHFDRLAHLSHFTEKVYPVHEKTIAQDWTYLSESLEDYFANYKE